MTYQVTRVISLRDDVHLTIIDWQFGDVKQRRGHRPVIHHYILLGGRLAVGRLAFYDCWEFGASRGSLGDACEELFLRLQSLVALSFTKLLQAVAHHHLVEAFQFRLHALSIACQSGRTGTD